MKILNKFVFELLAGFAMALVVACASLPPLDDWSTYTEISVEELKDFDLKKSSWRDHYGERYIVHAQIRDSYGYKLYLPYDKNTGRETIRVDICLDDFVATHPDFTKRVEENRTYTVYIIVDGESHFITNLKGILNVVEIDGLRSAEEIEAEKKAEEEAKQKRILEAQKAREEANKYDPKDFYFVGSDFKPANYSEKDLFDAVTEAENLPINYKNDFDWLGLYSRNHFSDVIFVRQDGRNVLFKTSDNAISQIMKISGRSGLKNGEKVRVYYRFAKEPILEWNVAAIKKR